MLKSVPTSHLRSSLLTSVHLNWTGDEWRGVNAHILTVWLRKSLVVVWTTQNVLEVRTRRVAAEDVATKASTVMVRAPARCHISPVCSSVCLSVCLSVCEIVWDQVRSRHMHQLFTMAYVPDGYCLHYSPPPKKNELECFDESNCIS